jgi:hypothetical protein
MFTFHVEALVASYQYSRREAPGFRAPVVSSWWKAIRALPRQVEEASIQCQIHEKAIFLHSSYSIFWDLMPMSRGEERPISTLVLKQELRAAEQHFQAQQVTKCPCPALSCEGCDAIGIAKVARFYVCRFIPRWTKWYKIQTTHTIYLSC